MTQPDRHILILGTGRCGTKSAASLVNRQPGAKAWHEPGPQMPLDPGRAPESIGTRIDRQRGGSGATLTAESAYWLLPYAASALESREDVRVVCLMRDRSEVVESFRRAGTHTPLAWSGIDDSGGYWDWYVRGIGELRASHPDRTMEFRTRSFSDKEDLDDLLKFMGIPAHKREIEPVWENLGKAAIEAFRRHRGGWENAPDREVMQAWRALPGSVREQYIQEA